MRLISIFVFLFMFPSVGHSHEFIKMSWLKAEISMDKIHNQRYESCLSFYNKIENSLIERKNIYKEKLGAKYTEEHEIKWNKSLPKMKACTLKKGNAFKHNLVDGYKVYVYDSPLKYWKSLSGSKGYALVINGEVVETIKVMVN